MPYMGFQIIIVLAEKSKHAQYVLGSMHMPIGLEGLRIPTGGCSVHMPIIFINFKLRGTEHISVPYMMKFKLTHIPVECGVVDPYVYRFLNGSGYAMVIPP